jgi:hypothetical protein
MFKKKVAEVKEESKPVEPQVVEELPVESEEVAETEEEQAEPIESEETSELTEEQVRNVLEKLSFDVQAIKHHLRLDFI